MPGVHKQSIQTYPYKTGSSTTIGLYESSIALVLDYRNNINLLKHKYEKLDHDLTINRTVDIMMDMLCRMIYQGRMDLFQEGMKIKLCEAIIKVLEDTS